MLTITDPIDYTLLEAWLVTCTCKEPTITKVLKTNLPASYNKPIVKVLKTFHSYKCKNSVGKVFVLSK